MITITGYVTVLGETRDLVQVILVCAVVSGLPVAFCSDVGFGGSWLDGQLAEFRKQYPLPFCCLDRGFVAALGGWWWFDLGSGYEETRALLANYESVPWYFGPAKFIATVAAYLTGFTGGIFAPSLAIGAALASDLAPFLSGHAIPDNYRFVHGRFYGRSDTGTNYIVHYCDGNGEWLQLVMDLMATALIASAVSRLISRLAVFDLGREYDQATNGSQ